MAKSSVIATEVDSMILVSSERWEKRDFIS
jgi:hypothetical protein